MPKVTGWIVRGERGDLQLVAELSLPSNLHNPQTKVILSAHWPEALGILEEALEPSSLGVARGGSSKGITVGVQAGVPGYFQAKVDFNRANSIQIPASPKYGTYSNKVVELSGFSSGIATLRAFYRVTFPVSKSQGHGWGTRLRWKLSGKNEWEEVPIELTELWADEVERRLPSSYWRYRGNGVLKNGLTEELVGLHRPHAILLHGPGGIGKTALVRAALTEIEKPIWSRVLGFTAQGEYYDVIERRTRLRQDQVKAKRDMYTFLANDLQASWDGRELEEAHKLVKARISDAGQVLFILDNLESAEEFESLLPLVLGLVGPPNGTVIITTRELPNNWERWRDTLSTSKMVSTEVTRLEPIDVEAIIRDVIFHAYGSTAPTILEADLKRIIDKSDGHPLSAKFFAHTLFAGEKGFLDSTKSRKDLLDFCFAVQWKRLNASQQDVLIRLRDMGVTAIPESDLVDSLSLQSGRKGVKEALKRLRELSFVELSSGMNANRVTLHSLVREWLETR
jgi:hypothetical protein